ncbi:MAG TPA: ATP-binding cassette domain-containing protein [Candidatus Saccharimonadales bacterium]|nr:ATP-binding cassette domain-containing protein [Candidatus Saccharimonadales bacterium]
MANKYPIQAKNVHKSFGKLKVLEGIDLQIERGTIQALLGPNGAGKTTMVRILSTLLRADQGTVKVDGYDVIKQADDVRSRIGLTGQYAAVDEYLTGRENLRMMGRLYHLSKADVARRTEELLEQFDLTDAADRYAKTYSGGMRRRLDLAASLIATPPIIFLDEPTTGLDPRSRLAMWEMIEDLAAQGTTILLTTQHLEEADRLADGIVVIDHGKVIAQGTSDQLKGRVGRERIQFGFASDRDLSKAVKLVDGDSPDVDKKQRTLSVSNDRGVYKVKTILEKFESSKIKVTAMSLSKPTLDDVFLKLTGHKATDGENQNGTTAAKVKRKKK